MTELINQLLSVVRAMWRWRWIGLATAWGVAALGALILLRIPDKFEATARVYVDTKTVLKPLMRDLTVEPDIDQTLQMLARTLITRPNVEILMQKARLDRAGMSPADREAVIDRLMREIKLTNLSRDNVFTFSFHDTSPNQARLIVEQLVSLFVESDLGTKQRDVDAARGFIDQQIKAYEARLSEAENRVKEFKLRNLGMSDATGKDYFTRVATLADELSRLTLDMRASEQSRDALRRELNGESVTLVPDVPPPVTSPATPEIDARLDAQRRQLDELLRRYTDLHPDVVATRRLIARLEEQRQQEVEAKRRAEASKPVHVSKETSAAIQQTKLALAESEANLAALKVRVSDTQARLNQMRTYAARAPQIETELTQLNRDYEVVRRNYEALVGQREKAMMSEEVDTTRLARFRVIDPPRTGDKPVFPNRLMMAPLMLLAALVLAAGLCLLLVQLMPTIDSAAALRALSARKVLGSVSMLVTDEMARTTRRHGYVFASGLGGLFVGYGLWLAWMFLPGRV
jgi:polysaccharide chain length determinant protein (PEP-CTERM system associated)